MSRDEAFQIVRSNGSAAMSEGGSVITETNGNCSVLPQSQGNPEKLLSNVSKVQSDADARFSVIA